MRVVAWVDGPTWRACVDAVRDSTPDETEITLVCVVDEEIAAAAHGAFVGLFGRGHPERDPALQVDEQVTEAAHQLLRQASERLGRPSTSEVRRGRVEHEVVEAADGADLLVVVRDGDQTRLGPKSLGRAGRFIVDHAPCPVLLVWAGPPPSTDTVPHRHPPHEHPHPHPPHPPH